MIFEIRGAYIVTPAENTISVKKNDIFIKEGKVYFSRPAGSPDRVIKAYDSVVLPGLTNAHHHIYSTLSKGISCDVPFGDFLGNLKNLWWILDRSLTKEDVILSTVIALKESIKHGVTTVFDHHISGYTENVLSDIAEVFEAFGISGALAFETSDRNGRDFFEKSLHENIRFAETQSGRSVQGMIGLHASFTLSDRSLREIADASGYHPIHVHVAEGEIDLIQCNKRYGISLIERFDKFGLLRDNSLFAHCSNCTEGDMDILSEQDVFVAQAVDSNMNNGLNIGNISEFIKKGLRTAVGTDGMHSNVLKAMKNSTLFTKYLNRDCDIGYAEIKSLFLNNYELKKSFGFPLGINEGETADIAVFDYVPAVPLGSDNFLSHLLYGITESRCSHVIKNGRLLLDDYHVILDQYDDILAAVEKTTKELFSRFEKNKGIYR